jgi:cytochrome c nitrite reductase small subunit
MKKLVHWLTPPESWRKPVIVMLGIFFGLAAYAVYISKAPSYLSDNPQTCINCHVMVPQYANWAHSAHERVANCNDCHVPHNNVFNKYFFKAKDGLRHATIFTLRTEPQTIYILEAGRKVVHQNCIRCHGKLLDDHQTASMTDGYTNYKLTRDCIDCHRESPHGRVNGLATVPNALVYSNEKSCVPAWLEKQLKPEQ